MWKRLLQMCWIILVVESSVRVATATKETQLENQVPDDVSIITEISVQEIVNGQTIQRKPTQEELRLVQDKILEKTSNKDNDMLPSGVENNTPAAVEDLSAILKSDSSDAYHEFYLFDDWNDENEEDEDPSEMESILRDDVDDSDKIDSNNRDKTRDNNGMNKKAFDEKDKDDLLSQKSMTASKEPPTGDYRKFFHTEKKNFSNVKDIKIVISEKEGDFFDDDEDSFFMQRPSTNLQNNFITTTTHASVLKHDADKFDLIKEILSGTINNSSDFRKELTTAPSFENETLANIIGELSSESSQSTFADTTTVNTDDINVNSPDSTQSADTTDNATIISNSEDEEATRFNDYSKDVLDRGKDDFVTTTVAPNLSQETTAFPVVPVPEESEPPSETTTVSNSSAETSTTKTSSYIEEIPETVTNSNIVSEVDRITAVSSSSAEISTKETFSYKEEVPETSTYSEITEEQLVTMTNSNFISEVDRITAVSHSTAEISTTETSSYIEEIPETSTYSEITEEQLVTMTNSNFISEVDRITAVSHSTAEISTTETSSYIEEIPETSTYSETTEEELVTVTNSNIISEVDGEVRTGNTSAILPVTLENTVSSTVFSQTEVYVATTVSDSERDHGIANGTDAETSEAVDSEVLAENGVSIQDISEIISLAENSYHEIIDDDVEGSDISNTKETDYTTNSLLKEFDADATTNSSLTTEARDPVVIAEPITIRADTSTEQIIPLENTEKTSAASLVDTEEAEVTTLEEFVTFPSTVLIEHETSSIEPTYTTENGSAVFIVTAVDYSEASTESVYIEGSMEDKTPPSSTETIFSDPTGDTVVDQTTITSNKDEISKNSEVSPLSDSDTDEIEAHNLTPSEVESILNAQLEDYDEDDYDTKEGIEGWTIFGGNDKEHSIDLNATDKNIVGDYDPVAAVGREMTPVIRARILNNSAEFSVKISKKGDTFFIPATAYVKEYGRIVNITWRATADQNNSLAMRVFENEKFHIIKEIVLYVFAGNKFSLQKKLVAINPDPILDDTMPGRTRMVMMRDGTYITFSNVEFLKIAESSSERAENSAAAAKSQRLWHLEVASISIATVLIVALVLYVIALKTKTKITLREKDELPQVTNC